MTTPTGDMGPAQQVIGEARVRAGKPANPEPERLPELEESDEDTSSTPDVKRS
jgi:hypothetical protein